VGQSSAAWGARKREKNGQKEDVRNSERPGGAGHLQVAGDTRFVAGVIVVLVCAAERAAEREREREKMASRRCSGNQKEHTTWPPCAAHSKKRDRTF
jgi:hypothetical protein